MPVDVDLWTESLYRENKRITNSVQILKLPQKDKKSFSIFIED